MRPGCGRTWSATRAGPGHLPQGTAGPQRLGPVRQGPVQHRLHRRAADLPRRGDHAVPARQDRPLPRGTCAACPLRERCTASRNGRGVSAHPDEELLAELRQRQQTPDGCA